MDIHAFNFNDRLINALRTDDIDSFKSEVGHLLKEKGDIGFIEEILLRNPISFCMKHGMKFKALYLLAMLDYLSKKNDYPICPVFDDLRNEKMEQMVYPSVVSFFPNEMLKKYFIENSIDEFLKYNICEGDVYNAC